jgi:hypothetical protein
MSHYVLTVLLMGAFGGYALWMMSKRKQALANLGPVLRSYFERTGYRYTHISEEALDAQVRYAEQTIGATQRGGGGSFEMDLVRDYHGVRIRHHQFMGTKPNAPNTYIMSCNWKLYGDKQPKTHFQAAARSLSSVGKAVKEMFGNTTRHWSAHYPQKVESGDPELDKRFVFFGENAEAVTRALQFPGLKEAMLAVQELDLLVDDEGVSFADPMQKNLRASMGGTVGAMAVGMDYGKLLSLTIPVHDQVAELLALASRASQA